MSIDELIEGTLVRLIKDHETVGQVRRINRKKGTVAIMVLGKVRWVKFVDLELKGDENEAL